MTRDDFLTHVGRRAALIADPGLDGAGRSADGDYEDADHLLAVAADFADQVDRDNVDRTVMPLTYPEAVLIVGERGPRVVHRDVYAADRVAAEAPVGGVDAVFDGLALLGWT